MREVGIHNVNVKLNPVYCLINKHHQSQQIERNTSVQHEVPECTGTEVLAAVPYVQFVMVG